MPAALAAVLAAAALVAVAVAVAVAAEGGVAAGEIQKAPWRMHTLFSVECQDYFDWQTVGLVHSFRKARQPGPITRLLSCTEEEKKSYKGFDLAPTMEVPSMSRHPKTGDWYPAINKPAGIVHWLKYSEDAQNVDWVVILDADMIIRGPIVPWELGAEKGKPVAAYYGYLVGCDNILAHLHTLHPELCDKVGGLLAMHIDDLRAMAPMWLSKTEEVREDRAHWATNLTGDIYGKGWISEMYGYSFGAAEVGLQHKINDDLMIYPGYIPRPGVEPILMHYGLPFQVGNWSFSKLEHHEDHIVYECNHLFPPPPYPREVLTMEADANKRRGLFLSIECINTLNEGLMKHHARVHCPKPHLSKYLSFLKSKSYAELTKPKYTDHHEKDHWVAEPKHIPHKPKTVESKRISHQPEKVEPEQINRNSEKAHPKIHTVFSTECTTYFDWQTVGLMHSFYLSGQPGNITRLLSCTVEDLKHYKGQDLAPTHYVPSMSEHPLTGDWYPAINKPAAVLHWLNHAKVDAEYIVILDADMILRGPITPWEFNAKRGHPVSTPYGYLIGCDNELAKLHTSHPEACEKVGGVIIMHIEDLRKFALLWLHKTEEVRADKEHYATNITGDIYASGWISEMYGYSFGAAELRLRHVIDRNILLYPGYVPEPGVKYRVFHYGLEFKVGNWSFDKANWRDTDVANTCWAKFSDPPDPSTLSTSDNDALQRDLLSIECVSTLNKALLLHHQRKKCLDRNAKGPPTQPALDNTEVLDSTEVPTRKSGRVDLDLQTLEKIRVSISAFNTSSLTMPSRGFRSLRLWLVLLWAFSVLGFLGVISLVLSSRKTEVARNKGNRGKRKSYNGSSGSSINLRQANEKHLLDAEIHSEV